MKKIFIIISIVIIKIFILINCTFAQESTYIRYYKNYENGSFSNLIYGSAVVNMLSYYRVVCSAEGLVLYAEKYVSGSIVERIYLYDNGNIKIKEVYENPLYSQDITNQLTYTSAESPNTIYYYTKDGNLIGKQTMEEYLYNRTFYDEGIRKYFDDFNLDFLFIQPDYVFGEKIIKGFAKRTNSVEVVFTNNEKIKRVEIYQILNKLRRIPVNIYDFKYNNKGLLSKIKKYTFREGKLYFNTEYRFHYDSFNKVISRQKILFYTNLLFIDEVVRYRYDGNQLKKVSKYENLTVPFLKKQAKDEDFRLIFDAFFDHNPRGYISRILYKTFLYRKTDKEIAYDSIERSIEYTYTENNKIAIITELLRNALNRVLHFYYDSHDNLIRKERIIYYDISKNENITYEYYDDGKGPLKKVIHDSFVKKEKLIEHYISKNSIDTMEIYYGEKLAGIFKFNFSGDIVTEIKYEKNEKIKHVDYQYYNNGCVHSAIIYDNEIILKIIYFSEEIPFLYGAVVRVDHYMKGSIFVSHFYYRGKKIKSIFYKDGKIHYIKEYFGES